MKKNSGGRPSQTVPCGWCKDPFPVSKLRGHLTNCPKRPPAGGVEARAAAFSKLNGQLLDHWGRLFTNYDAWTNAQTAIDLMAAEITTLRTELAEARRGYSGSIESREQGLNLREKP